MSTSMVSTVLEIEREAEAVLAKAAQDAEKILADAKARREDAAKNHADSVAREVANLESLAQADRAAKVRELTASGDSALSAVRNISDAAFAGGVQYILKALAAK